MFRLIQVAMLAVTVWLWIGQVKADTGKATGAWSFFAYTVDDDLH